MPSPEHRFRPLLRGGLLLFAWALTACASHDDAPPDLSAIYDRAASHHDLQRNPVVVIPGILGSTLAAGDETVWGAFAGNYADPETPEGARRFAHPIGDSPLRELRDEVAPTGVLESFKVNVAGLPFELAAYLDILRALGIGGYRDKSLGESGAVDYGPKHYTCFQFSYDWRRDNVENAARLGAFLRKTKAYIEAENLARYGYTQPIKFDLVAHSMGALLARYFVRYGEADLPQSGELPAPTWKGAELVERLIAVGVPSAGSLKTVTNLTEGVSFAPLLPGYAPALVGTLPSVYQVLPRTRHAMLKDAQGEPVDLFDVATWERYGWGLMDPEQAHVLAWLLPDLTPPKRRALARAYLERALARAQRFQAALDQPSTPPETLDLCLIAGDAMPTPSGAKLDSKGRVVITQRGPGDGTVLRTSALLDERVGRAQPQIGKLDSPIEWSQVLFVFREHLEITRDPHFVDNVLYLLLEDPRKRIRRAAERDRGAPAPTSRPAAPRVKSVEVATPRTE